jgi:hypothetical protein
MKFYGEMRVQGGGPLDGSRFDALAYALAAIEETDPAIEDVDLTASLAQGWVTASMTIVEENLQLAVAKLIATVRSAIYPDGDHAGGWQFLTETAGLSVYPAADRAGTGVPDNGTPSGTFAVPNPAAPSGAPAPPALPTRTPLPPLPPVTALPPRPPLPARAATPSRPDAPVSVWR